MITKSSKYAIRAVLYLAKNATIEKKIGSKLIAKELEIPAPFLAKTLQELTRKKIVSSVKGPNGGFYLSEINEKKSLFDIIDCIDNKDKFEECYLGQSECNDKKPCVIHHLYAPFKKNLLDRFKSKTIIEISHEKLLKIDNLDILSSF